MPDCRLRLPGSFSRASLSFQLWAPFRLKPIFKAFAGLGNCGGVAGDGFNFSGKFAMPARKIPAQAEAPLCSTTLDLDFGLDSCP